MSEFEPKVFRHTLARDILVVARTRVEGTWKAYIGSTGEWSHKNSVGAILDHGTAVREPLARVIFPHFKKLPYAR